MSTLTRRDIHTLVDRRIELKVPSGVIEPLRGVVTGKDTATRRLMVRMGPVGTQPVPVPYPALPVDVQVGDDVVVFRGKGGWWMVDSVLGRDRIEQGLPTVTIRASGGDDAPAINVAIASAVGGVILAFPDLEYILATRVLVNKDNVYFMGRGGADNPTAAGSTTFRWGGSAEPMITWDKLPGLTAQPVASPQYDINGGGLSRIVVNGGLVASEGIRVVSAQNLLFSDFTIRGCVIDLNTTNHGTPAGGADQYDQTLRLSFERGQIITTTGTGIRLDGNTYACNFRGVGVVVTGAGIGIDLYGVDDIWFYSCPVLCQDVGGTQLRLNGADYGGKAATGVQFVTSYFNGAVKKITTVGDGFDGNSARSLFLGLGTEDGEVTWDTDAGAVPSYLDMEGRHNLRQHAKTTFSIKEDFPGGSLSTGSIGELGWAGAPTFISSEANHPGLRNVATGAVAGTLASLYLPNSTSLGLLLPSESFDSEFIFRLNTSDTDTMGRVGFGMSPAADPPTNGFWFEKLYADTDWYAVTRQGGVQTRSSALVAVGAGTWLRFRIRRQNNVAIGFSIGDTVNHNDTVRMGTTVPTAALNPFFQVKNQTAVSKTLDVDFFQLHITGLSR